MAELLRVASGTPWEPVVGYSRAVKAGTIACVSGTTATAADGKLVGIGQMYIQARQALENIRTALQRMGLAMRDVVRTRIFVTDITRWNDVARAHREFFGEHPPACTMVEVRRLISTDMLVEIEADAWVGEGRASKSEPKPAAKSTARAVPAKHKAAPARKPALRSRPRK
ncbi:MAG TPA: RidA family protein [Candidatus Binataceae bacterium]|nr:RidA family protein [Candidatus Binataceae bacterium]